MSMEIPIPNGAYSGLPTPFGGPSLEWEFSSAPDIGEMEEDARLSVGGLPTIIMGVVTHIRRIAEVYPKSSAGVHRRVLCVGVPIIEGFVESNPMLADSLDRALMMSAEDGVREFRIKKSRTYPLSLGPQEVAPRSIYARNKNYVSRVWNMSEDIGLSVSKLTILCLVAGLAQSLDPAWVPPKWRESFIQEVRFFEKWLRMKG